MRSYILWDYLRGFVITILIIMSILNLFNPQPFVEDYYFIEQYIGAVDTFGTNFKPAHDCLIMKVRHCDTGTDNTFFFANEHVLRADLKQGDRIQVRWCAINGQYLIRGLLKK